MDGKTREYVFFGLSIMLFISPFIGFGTTLLVILCAISLYMWIAFGFAFMNHRKGYSLFEEFKENIKKNW